MMVKCGWCLHPLACRCVIVDLVLNSVMLNFFRYALEAVHGTANALGLYAAQQHLQEVSPTDHPGPTMS
jgi:hypothetical protein